MTNLPRPDFIARDPQQVEQDAIALYEQTVDKKLYPAQPERLLLDVLSYRETLIRLAIQDAAEQNLVNYARGVNLDQLGALLDVARLPPSAARTTLRFTKDPGAVASSLVVPAGTRAQTEDGNFLFASEAALTIAAGVASGVAFANCTIPGIAGNGYNADEITTLVDRVPSIAAVTNLTTSNGGANLEEDERLRNRIKLAPSKFSVAGSYESYLYWILSSDQSIIDAAILSPFRTLVRIYPLTAIGLPSSEILDKVRDIVGADKIRPLTDSLEVLAPTQVSYQITASVVLYATADAASLQARLNAAAAAFSAAKSAKLGQDIIRTQLIAALSNPEVYSVILSAPAADIVVAPNQWAKCTAIAVTISGINDG